MEDQIDIKRMLAILSRRWWVVVSGAVIMGLIAFLFTYFMISPLYDSQGLLYVNNNSNNQNVSNVELNDITTAQKLVNTYAEILKSDSFLSQVIHYSDLNYTPEKLRTMVSMSARNQTELLEIKATSKSAQESNLIVDTILKLSSNEITRVIKGGSVEIVDNASYPNRPSSPNIKMNTLIGVLIGMILGALIIFVMELLDTRVKDQNDLLARYNLPVLGIIPNLVGPNK